MLNKTWTVAYDDRLDDDGELGNCLGWKCAITYGKDASSSKQQFRDTILHEHLHAIFYETGLAYEMKDPDVKVDEEMIVRRVSTVLLHLMRSNPELVKFWMEKDK